MAKICPTCKKEIEDNLTVCNLCGCPVPTKENEIKTNVIEESNKEQSFFSKHKEAIIIVVLVLVTVIITIIGICEANKSNNSEIVTSEATTAYPEPSAEYAPSEDYETDSNYSSSTSYPTKEEFINCVEAAYSTVYPECYLSSPRMIEQSFEISVFSEKNIQICTITALVDINGVDEGKVTGVMCIASDSFSNLSYTNQSSTAEASLSVLPATMALSAKSYFSKDELINFINDYFSVPSRNESGFLVWDKMYSGYQTKFMINDSYKTIAFAGEGTKLLDATGY